MDRDNYKQDIEEAVEGEKMQIEQLRLGSERADCIHRYRSKKGVLR